MSVKFSLIYEPQTVYSETGYHATLTKNKESIMNEGFKPSNKDDDWLGEGIYFWDDIKNAEWWNRKSKAISKCVFICNLTCNLINYLDLDNKVEMDKLNVFSKRYMNEMIKKSHKKPVFKNNNQIRKFFCDIYCSKNDISILSFTFKHDIINEAGFKTGTLGRKQICVRELSCISIIDIKG